MTLNISREEAKLMIAMIESALSNLNTAIEVDKQAGRGWSLERGLKMGAYRRLLDKLAYLQAGRSAKAEAEAEEVKVTRKAYQEATKPTNETNI